MHKYMHIKWVNQCIYLWIQYNTKIPSNLYLLYQSIFYVIINNRKKIKVILYNKILYLMIFHKWWLLNKNIFKSTYILIIYLIFYKNKVIKYFTMEHLLQVHNVSIIYIITWQASTPIAMTRTILAPNVKHLRYDTISLS